jgi:hypothetical protein
MGDASAARVVRRLGQRPVKIYLKAVEDGVLKC